MKLSFVIPAHNEEKLIGKCLNSIIKELNSRKSSDEVEIVVVNNASQDRTGEIAKSFPGVIVVDEPKKGIVEARRAGLSRATGELVANVDADTMLTPGWVDKVLEKFEKNPNLVAFSGPFILYDMSLWVRFWSRVFYILGYLTYLFNQLFLGVGMLQGGNFIFRKSAFEKIGGYNSKIIFYGEDSDVARRLSKEGEVIFSFDLPILASGRRMKKEGLFRSGIKYVVNYIWTIYFNKPSHEDYTAVRWEPDQE